MTALGKTQRLAACFEPRHWLERYPWEQIVWTLSDFWHLPPERIETADAWRVRERWEAATAPAVPLRRALDLCRECHAARPFGKYDREIFVVVAEEIIRPLLADFSLTLGRTMCAVVADYIRGAGNDIEMLRALALLAERAGHSLSSGSR